MEAGLSCTQPPPPSAPWRRDPATGRALAFGDPFVVQWHLTDRCNLACLHCYRSGPVRKDLQAHGRRQVLAEILRFVQGRRWPARLHLAGGEPFLCDDLLELMQCAFAHGIPSRILSNGTVIDPRVARQLRGAGCLGVQVSIEGPEPVHDGIRGKGSFRAALEGVRVLRDAGVSTTLSMTVHAGNVAHVAAVGRLARDHADRVYFSRLVPCGRGAELGGTLGRDPWWEVMRTARSLATSLGIEVALRDPNFRAWFASARHARHSGAVAGCAAGHWTLTVEADGTVMPCRRIGVGIGQVLDDGLERIWTQSEVLAGLRDRDRLQGQCGRCDYRWVCGGCRAIALAMGNGLDGEDPQCPWTLTRVWEASVRRSWANLRRRTWRAELGR